jgi:decaprenyl-phosphate phosphoribosyltransferase
MSDHLSDVVTRPAESATVGARTTFADLVSAARPGYWSRHVFILPGLLVALVLTNAPAEGLWIRVLLGFAGACLLASANYVLNEWLDAEFDREHPLKRLRPAASGRLSARAIYVEYAVLAIVGLATSVLVSGPFFVTSVLFLGSGILYNVRPLRTKERVHLDVLTEAINNPIRLLLGWFMVSSTTVPPLSLLLLYWCGGAFLMATKRLAEYRYLVDAAGAGAPGRYRKSFERYSQPLLLLACFLYAILASFFLAVFLIKYRAEFVLAVPLFAFLFAYYLYDALDDTAAAQAPERFYRRRGLMPIIAALIVVVVVLTFVDIPVLEQLIQSRFGAIRLGR